MTTKQSLMSERVAKGTLAGGTVEVLTRKGWKHYNEVVIDDEIATLNPQTENIEYQKPITITRHYYDGKMYSRVSMAVDVLASPNARLWVTSRDTNKWKTHFRFRTPREIEGKNIAFKKTGIWTGVEQNNFVLPSVKLNGSGANHTIRAMTVPALTIPMDEWLDFFGFWIAEGSTTKSSNGGYIVQIGQKTKPILEHYQQLLNRWGIHSYISFQINEAHLNGWHALHVTNKQLFSHLRQFGKAWEKFIPEEIKKLSSRQCTILYNSYYKGDGAQQALVSNSNFNSVTTSKRLADDLQELALKLGTDARVSYISKPNGHAIRPQWQIFFRRPTKLSVIASSPRNATENWVNYKGLIWNIVVPNQIFYIRRNGKPLWMGNNA